MPFFFALILCTSVFLAVEPLIIKATHSSVARVSLLSNSTHTRSLSHLFHILLPMEPLDNIHIVPVRRLPPYTPVYLLLNLLN
jgi:hypothetical protein